MNGKFLLATGASFGLILGQGAAAEPPANLALGAKASSSSVLEVRYSASNAVDGVVSDDSRWVSRREDENKWLELDLGKPRKLGCAHVYSGFEDGAAIRDFRLETWTEGRWRPIPAASITGNTRQSLTVRFGETVLAQRLRFVPTEPGPARLRELALFAENAPLGTGVKLAAAEAGVPVAADRHLIALNQVGYETGRSKRFTAPLSPDGTKFEVRQTGTTPAQFRGEIRGGIGDFSEFRPRDSKSEYVVVLSGGILPSGTSDPFAIRQGLYREQFWQGAVDFMIDARSVVGTHPSAYGGCPWRDGTYYDFIVPSLVDLWLADPAAIRSMPVQMDWLKDKAKVLSAEFKFDAKNPHSEGVMEAVRRYYAELEPPKAGAPDAIQLIHWGLGYYLMNPATRDPSADPLPRQIHSQTVEQFSFFLYAWPQLKEWLPQSFYERCRDFAFEHWKTTGLLEVDPLWDAGTYLAPEQMEGPNPTGGSLHPYKGRHTPGHSIQPNLLMHEVAKRERREDAGIYLDAARKQANWVIERLDWNDPRTTKGQRMSEHKTVPGLVWFLQHYPGEAPPGLKQKLEAWARTMVLRSENQWDFRRYDLGTNWTIPKLNEPGNLAAFTASALAASWVVTDEKLKHRLQELAVAQVDNLFGRNPRLAAAPEYPEKGWPLIERGWPRKFPDNVCARLETTRSSLSASPGSEMYPFNPQGAYRHAEGWVNFNAAWNVALAYLAWDAMGEAWVRAQAPDHGR